MQIRVCYENLHLKFDDILSYTYKDMSLYAHNTEHVLKYVSKLAYCGRMTSI